MNSSKYSINISTTCNYIDSQSSSQDERFVYTYTITIKNTGELAAQLINRHWIITDSNQDNQEVKGKGVVGEQPTILPGDSFTYTSGAILKTPIGSMHGSYQMVSEDGTSFNATIPAFTLAPPYSLH